MGRHLAAEQDLDVSEGTSLQQRSSSFFVAESTGAASQSFRALRVKAKFHVALVLHACGPPHAFSNDYLHL